MLKIQNIVIRYGTLGDCMHRLHCRTDYYYVNFVLQCAVSANCKLCTLNVEINQKALTECTPPPGNISDSFPFFFFFRIQNNICIFTKI